MQYRLLSDWTRFRVETDRLVGLISTLGAIPVRHRVLVAEICMIRLFLLADNALESICLKILCGAYYADGNRPQLIRQAASSVANARALVVAHTGKQYPTWSRSREIRGNMKKMLQPSDPLFQCVSRSGQQLAEMKDVRNHIAHRSGSSRKHFREVVKNYYGGYRRGVTPGSLLLTTKLNRPRLLDTYITQYRVLVKELVRA